MWYYNYNKVRKMENKKRADCGCNEIPMKIFKHDGKNYCVDCYKKVTKIRTGYSYK